MEKNPDLNIDEKKNPFIYNNLNALIKKIKNDKPIYVFISTSTLVIFILSLYFKSNINYSLTTYLKSLLSVCYVSVLCWAIYYYFHLLIKKHPHPLFAFYKKIKSLLIPLHRVVYFIFLILALNITFSTYTYLKSIIPDLHPFQFDSLFAQIDNSIHFGVEPWQITHTIFNNAWSTLFLNILYNAWFFFMWGVLLFFILYKHNEKLRMQFLLTFLSSWLVIGGFFATLLSSVGPCFYEPLLGSERFTPLMNQLAQQNQFLISNDHLSIWALSTQNELWNTHIRQANEIGAGISAMPSMHVSIAVLLAIAMYNLDRRLGAIAWIYALLIQIGSVHLGWHYAIDGYTSILLTTLLWKSIGAYLKRKTYVNEELK